MLETLDGHTGELLGELYETDIAQLSEAISLMHPSVGKTEVRQRATLLAAIPQTKALTKKAFATAMRMVDAK